MTVTPGEAAVSQIEETGCPPARSDSKGKVENAFERTDWHVFFDDNYPIYARNMQLQEEC